MRRILILSILMAFSLLHALTPITLQFGENEATYYREFLNLFDVTADHDEALVTCILDGDIFTIVRHKTLNFLEVIHLIGVDAPDSTHSDKTVEKLGLKSSEFARVLLEDKRVLLTYDITPWDSYGRYLAYVWLPAVYEGNSYYVLFNLLALTNGYSRVYTTHPFNDYYMEIFIEAGRQAKLQRRGLWAEEDFANIPAEPLFNPIVYITNTGEKYHQYHCQYLLESRIPIRLSEAVYLGYEPCSVCRPPIMFMKY